MHFCSSCQNMYYIRIEDDNSNKLIYYCRHCGNESSTLNVDNTTVSKSQFSGNNKQYTHIINQYTKLDPTLPRINKILCANSSCTTNTEDSEREIIYIRYDDSNIKYVYMCSTCDHIWTTEN